MELADTLKARFSQKARHFKSQARLIFRARAAFFHQGSWIATLTSGHLWCATLFLLLSSILGIFWCATLFSLISLGVGLAYTLIGVIILALTMQLWRGGAQLERLRLARLLDFEITSPYRPLPVHGRMARAIGRARDIATWRDLLYLLLLFPLGLVEGLFVSLAWTMLLGCMAALIYLPFYCLTSNVSLQDLPRFSLEVLLVAVPAALLGSFLLWLIPPCTHTIARFHGKLAQKLLGPSQEKLLTESLEELRQSRTRILDAALLERQRIERDLHDGAQQRLVAIGLNLGLAREKIQTDPQSAIEFVEEAHQQTKQAIRDIRDLVRGIHPAVLSDRGLDPAISALVSRLPLPVVVKVELSRRFSETIEATAYFVISEALTNIAKHSQASQVELNLFCDSGKLCLEIIDNGIGGARATPGGGLAGLVDRVEALDGCLSLESPASGPTTIKVELPCE